MLGSCSKHRRYSFKRLNAHRPCGPREQGLTGTGRPAHTYTQEMLHLLTQSKEPWQTALLAQATLPVPRHPQRLQSAHLPPLPQGLHTPGLKGGLLRWAWKAGQTLSPQVCVLADGNREALTGASGASQRLKHSHRRLFPECETRRRSSFMQIPRFCVSAASLHNGLSMKPLGSTRPPGALEPSWGSPAARHPAHAHATACAALLLRWQESGSGPA